MFNTYIPRFPTRPNWDNIFSFKFYPAEFSGFNYLQLCFSLHFLFCRSFVRSLFGFIVHAEKPKFLFFRMVNLYEIELKIKWLCAYCVLWWSKTISSAFSSVDEMWGGVLMPLLYYLFSYQISNRTQINKWKTRNIFFNVFRSCFIDFHAYFKHSQTKSAEF